MPKSKMDSLTSLDLASLELALIVLEHGSFRGAAASLDVRPSVISRRIQTLEDAIGVSLFQRQTQGSQPTRAGAEILASGRKIIEQSRNLLRIAQQRGTASAGSLCVGVVASIAGGKCRRLLKSFLTDHPEVDLELVEGSSRDHIAAVRALRMDASFVVGDPPALDCQVDALWSEQIMVVLPSEHALAGKNRISMADLAEERFVVSEVDPGPEVQDYVIARLARLGHHPLVDVSAVQREGLMALVGLGRGVSLVCSAEAEVTYPDVVFRPLEEETIPFNVVWSTANDNPVLRRFLSLARVLARRDRPSTITPQDDAPYVEQQ